ncbi:hypothetical protein B9T62_22815 [Paenibacillus donghaensis]|uniref:Uncharacterized protein n=1 Tax=Paenibacillus donghaensis TaxID=414771 RepID=A0A2Z2KUG9_9BACL|nr:hypothetical protein B9T62_22815 [Paenibacillus donghaensis]
MFIKGTPFVFHDFNISGNIVKQAAGDVIYLIAQTSDKRKSIQMRNGGEINSIRLRQPAAEVDKIANAVHY